MAFRCCLNNLKKKEKLNKMGKTLDSFSERAEHF